MEYNKGLGGFRRIDVIVPFWGWPKSECLSSDSYASGLICRSAPSKGWVSNILRSYNDIRTIMVDDTKEIPEVRPVSNRSGQR
jgi:hypothetical protein